MARRGRWAGVSLFVEAPQLCLFSARARFDAKGRDLDAIWKWEHEHEIDYVYLVHETVSESE
jgi:hypothetical protein